MSDKKILKETKNIVCEYTDHGICYFCSSKSFLWTGNKCAYVCKHSTDMERQDELCDTLPNYSKAVNS